MEDTQMKQLFAALLCVGLFVGVSKAEEKPALKDQNDRTSYSIGYQIGGDLKRQGVGINPELMVKGVQDALGGKEPLMTLEEMQQELVTLKQKIVASQQEEQKKAAAENLAKGEAFLAENAKKEGVKTLPSGLQYQVLKKGEGTPPKATDTVTVQYRGTLIDGTEFDSSYSRGQPATFPLNRVIKGWTEGVQLMKPGAKYKFFIPPALAYGPRGAGPEIGPESTLIFEVELISIDEKANPDKGN
jgi:FKBP-type peptidyl-prolyl cis-trans isomerase FklB